MCKAPASENAHPDLARSHPGLAVCVNTPGTYSNSLKYPCGGWKFNPAWRGLQVASDLLSSSTAPEKVVIFVGEGVPFKSNPGYRFNRATYHSLRVADELKAAGAKVRPSSLLFPSGAQSIPTPCACPFAPCVRAGPRSGMGPRLQRCTRLDQLDHLHSPGVHVKSGRQAVVPGDQPELRDCLFF